MKKMINILVAVTVVMLLITLSAQAQLSIVVGKSSTNKAGLEELKQMFSGAKTSWDNGNKVQIADQADSDVGKKFYDKFIGKSAVQVRSQWMKLVLSGQGSAPVKCSDDAAVKKAVAENPNAVGYISSGAVDATVKEIGKIE